MVLLVNAPSELDIPTLPLGLAHIAAYLVENGIDVKAVDAWAEGMDCERLSLEAEKLKPEVVGFTMLSPNYENVKNAIKAVKKRLPATKIVVGGCHPSALPDEVLNDIPEVDLVVIGEGEKTFLELINALNQKDVKFAGIEGIAYREGAAVRRTRKRNFMENLDSLPFPARHLFPLGKYRSVAPYGRKKPFISLITSRGCPYSCAYCSKDVFGMSYRSFSAKRIIEEIKFLIDKYSVKEIRFYDDIFTLDKKALKEICDFLVDEKERPSWSCMTRVELVDPATLNMMKRSGCWLIAYGVESATKSVLERMSRLGDLEIVRRAFRWTRQAGIHTLGYFMIGLPGETREMIKDTIDFSIELDADFAAFSTFVLMPGSPFYKDFFVGKENSSFSRPVFVKSKSSSFPFSRQDRSYVGGLSLDELDVLTREANRRFYFRPSYMIRRMVDIRTPEELSYYMKQALKLTKWVFGER